MDLRNAPAPPDPPFYSWKPEPTTRGSFSIFSSCLITMTLCVWTSVHLNLPEYKKPSEQTWRKVMWLLIALLAPEYVAVTAYCQYKEAEELGRFMREELGQDEPQPWWRHLLAFRPALSSIAGCIVAPFKACSDYFLGDCKFCINPPSGWHMHPYIPEKYQEETTIKGRHLWTSTHSFYAVMGGFALSTHGQERNYLPGNRRRMTLTPKVIRLLARKDPTLLLDVSESEIRDKSKASGLAKTIVCFQASWFCIQCCTRWNQGLAVSLLELNTFAHSLCALLIFLFWWDKPLDIESPSLLHDERMQLLGASLAHHIYRHDQSRSKYRKFRLSAERFPAQISYPRRRKSLPSEIDRNVREIDLFWRQQHAGIKFHGYRSNKGRTPEDYAQEFVSLSSNELHCFHLLRSVSWREDPSWTKGVEKSLRRHGAWLLADRVSDFPQSRFLLGRNLEYFEITRSRLMIAIVLAGLCYGGLHLTAWNSSYRSVLEMKLWKISAVAIMVSGFIFLAAVFIVECGEWILHGANFPKIRRVWDQSVIVGVWLFLALVAPLYIFSRVYLVVESFLGLTHLPETAFLVPKWSQYFPHFA
ncbi:hypothetical protein BCR34DRAFT_667700 [Clohesyomyces aquaticus]|uniref:Uncharacterized protein n=1 Tax=Clohesyomyces aquaticus TaxID=1231657 RepID=A0A1Y1YWJ2_9PLEO|nr:hypothetical protein BCR34DRAFT_667700 [Clohesyomyces aquaticus]